MKVSDDPRKCGTTVAPRKTTTVPRVVHGRTLRTLWAAHARAQEEGRHADATHILALLRGAA